MTQHFFCCCFAELGIAPWRLHFPTSNSITNTPSEPHHHHNEAARLMTMYRLPWAAQLKLLPRSWPDLAQFRWNPNHRDGEGTAPQKLPLSEVGEKVPTMWTFLRSTDIQILGSPDAGPVEAHPPSIIAYRISVAVLHYTTKHELKYQNTLNSMLMNT
ncbi:hypothetical protein Hypma_000881 [Hypsizygus marmoreus]|uniref:Uncharacterized protein n=1 Tax=Hypsizygus marmoreus TaxID=39966 RepID=A0A369JER9_HYPMA|nr:hypothetical protein Hypma_000881 [Hypsizygus marmoreus]